MHANDVEHRLAVDGIARERAQLLGDARRLRVGFAAHQRGDRAGHVAAAVGIVRQRQGHQQRAEIGVAQAERAEIVGILGDARRGVAGVIHQNFLRGDGDVHGVAEGLHVERRRCGPRNFIRLSEARLQAVSSRNMYSEQGFEALMRAVPLQVCQRFTVVSYCMPGSPHCQADSAMRLQQFAGAQLFRGRAVVDVARPPVAIVFARPA